MVGHGRAGMGEDWPGRGVGGGKCCLYVFRCRDQPSCIAQGHVKGNLKGLHDRNVAVWDSCVKLCGCN